MQRGKDTWGPGGGGHQQGKGEAFGDAKPVDAWVVDFLASGTVRKYISLLSATQSMVFWYSTSGNTSDDDGEGSPGILLKLWSGH